MRLSTRKLIDKSFSGLGVFAIILMAAALVVILLPIFTKGAGAFLFRATVEHRRLLLEKFNEGDRDRFEAEDGMARSARAPVYGMLNEFREEVDGFASGAERRKWNRKLKEFEKALHELLGPEPGSMVEILPRNQYGQTRWDGAERKLKRVLFREEWDYSVPGSMGTSKMVPRKDDFQGTHLYPAFAYIEKNAEAMLRPRWTFYRGFITHSSIDSHIFGGIWPEVAGTIYLTVGAMLFAVPFGIVAAIYLAEYAHDGRVVSFLRICISTLAGVPSIVFGLFGLAFFINTMHISSSKSVLAGSLTLALLILPTVIRAAEEAIRAVPGTYREAALSLGSGKWKMVVSVILPAALPGILTGIVISMGRAAGETAPIIFTAAVSVGRVLMPREILTQPTPALPWNIYNLCTEHEAVDQIRHVQYGMVLTLIIIVLLLNLTAIWLRARVAGKLKG